VPSAGLDAHKHTLYQYRVQRSAILRKKVTYRANFKIGCSVSTLVARVGAANSEKGVLRAEHCDLAFLR